MQEQVISSISPGFPKLSQSLGQVAHVLLTRSPLTHRSGRVRLACVKHAASVRPEPGSNSPQTTRRGKPQSWHHKTKHSHSTTDTTHRAPKPRKTRVSGTPTQHTLSSSQETHTPTKPTTGQEECDYLTSCHLHRLGFLRGLPNGSSFGVLNSIRSSAAYLPLIPIFRAGRVPMREWRSDPWSPRTAALPSRPRLAAFPIRSPGNE